MPLTASRLVLLVAVLIPLVLAGETPELVIERDRITAGDLAEVMPEWGHIEPSTVLAYAPRPGIQRRLRPDELLRWARRYNVELGRDSLPEGIVVRRRLRRLTAEETRELIKSAAARYYRTDPAQVEITLHNFTAPMVPAGPLEFKLGSPPQRLNRPARMTLRWENDGGRSGSLPIRITVAVIGTQAVAVKDLPTGTELEPADFRFEEGPLRGPPDRYLFTEQEIEDKKLKVYLREGEALERRMLQKVEAVRRGDLLQIRIRSRWIQLQAPARAEQSGSIGDRILCRNLDSGRKITATIVNSKFAEVNLDP